MQLSLLGTTLESFLATLPDWLRAPQTTYSGRRHCLTLQRADLDPSQAFFSICTMKKDKWKK